MNLSRGVADEEAERDGEIVVSTMYTMWALDVVDGILIGEDEILSISFYIAARIPHEIYICLLSNIFRRNDEAQPLALISYH